MGKRGCFKISIVNLLWAILLVLIIVSIIKYSLKKRDGFSEGRELVLVHMNGCGHCKTLMPEWESASKENKTEINMRSVEMSEGDGPDLCKKHNITGFPTMILLDNGKKIKDYDGERNKNSILQFLQNN